MTDNKKKRIAKSLINGFVSMRPISKEASDFIREWCMTGNDGKPKDMYDIWEIVLKNHLPNQTPVLFRGCRYINSGKIESYTTKIDCAEKFVRNKKYYLLIMDSRYFTALNTGLGIGEYQHSYYPVFQLLRKEKLKNKSNFSKKFIEHYEREEECIAWTYKSQITVSKLVNL